MDLPNELANSILTYSISPYYYCVYTWFMNSSDETPRYNHVLIFESYKEAKECYDIEKKGLSFCAADHIIDFEDMNNYTDEKYQTLQFIVEKKTETPNGIEYEIFQDGDWKRPEGLAIKIVDKKKPHLLLQAQPVHRYFNW